MSPLAEADAGNADGPWSVYFYTIHKVLSSRTFLRTAPGSDVCVVHAALWKRGVST